MTANLIKFLINRPYYQERSRNARCYLACDRLCRIQCFGQCSQLGQHWIVLLWWSKYTVRHPSLYRQWRTSNNHRYQLRTSQIKMVSCKTAIRGSADHGRSLAHTGQVLKFGKCLNRRILWKVTCCSRKTWRMGWRIAFRIFLWATQWPMQTLSNKPRPVLPRGLVLKPRWSEARGNAPYRRSGQYATSRSEKHPLDREKIDKTSAQVSQK